MTVPGNLSSPLLATAAADAAAAAGPIKSLRFNSGDSAFLNRTPSSAGNRKKFTYSLWVKRCITGSRHNLFSTVNAATQERIQFGSNDKLDFIYSQGTANVSTEGLFRDLSAWYHIVFAVDTDQSTAADRVKLYVNGAQQTLSGTFPSSGTSFDYNNTKQHRIGSFDPGTGGTHFADCYLADIYLVDGSQLDATSFGAYDDNGVWQAAAYSGTFGTNGFHLLDFANESTVGHDSSGNNNDFTANNISTTAGVGNDVVFDVPTNGTQSDTGAGGEVSGNYAVLNPLDNGGATLANGNLNVTEGSSASMNVRATIGLTSGKYYWELTNNSPDYYATGSGNTNSRAGISSQDGPINAVLGSSAEHYVFEYAGVSGGGSGGRLQNNNSSSDFGSVIAQNDVLNIACDFTAGKIWYGKNGTFFNSGDPANGTNASQTFTPGGKAWFPAVAQRGVGGTNAELNFGQRAFSSSAPSGYKALCTTNLPTPTIADGSDYFEAKLYTGNGSTNTITGLEFSPDFTWIKKRNSNSSHSLHDTVRGATKRLVSNNNTAETTETTALTAFTSDGFTLGSGGTANGNNDTFVSWNWDAASSTASNTDGSVTSSVRASQTAGFSIVSYTATGSNLTVGHGLNATPAVIITKDRSAAKDWLVMHESIGVDHFLKLNVTQAKAGPYTNVFTSVSNTTFGTGNDAGINTNGNNRIAYCFAPVAGYSAFGSYTGNGSSDGPFVHTGFKIRWLLVKNTSSARNWVLLDTARSDFNVANDALYPDLNNAEDTGTNWADLLSNGFKMRTSNASYNASGSDYIYAAFAENPFQANGGLAR